LPQSRKTVEECTAGYEAQMHTRYFLEQY